MNLNSKKKQQEAMKAYLRIKPCDETFLTVSTDTIVSVRGQGEFRFDKVFDENSSNDSIFQQIGDPLIKHSLQGFNASVLAYGQTSSGKTFTMKGDAEHPGIIPKVIKKLFHRIQEQRLVGKISISYMEIYNENIIDLLSSNTGYLDVQENCMRNVTVTNLKEEEVTSVQTAMALFQEGESRRKVASNNININSSRSHTIFRIMVAVVDDQLTRTESCINMVDLAGSEGVSRTRAEGHMKKEGQNINKSILALTNVFRGMSEKHNYVNYRDSKLTRLLQSSFCSNSRSIVICTVNPIPQNYQETINTMKFGMYASDIKMDVKRNLKESQDFTGDRSDRVDTSDDERLKPKERIEYEDNKRVIAQMRNDCSQFRKVLKEKDNKISFLELENHKLRIELKGLEKLVEDKEKIIQMNSGQGVAKGQLHFYEKQIATKNQEMEIMAERYEALNELYNRSIKNQRYLVDRMAKYESQIAMLKDSVQQTMVKEEQNAKPKSKTPIKPSRRSIAPVEQDICPFTIGSIMRLKASIVELKVALYYANEEIVRVSQQRNEFQQALQQMQEDQGRRMTSKYNNNLTEQKQIRNLNIRNKKLKHELNYHRNYEKRLLHKLKEKSSKGLEEMEEFHEFYIKKMEEESKRKRREKSIDFQAQLNNLDNRSWE